MQWIGNLSILSSCTVLKWKLMFFPQPVQIAVGFYTNLQWNSLPYGLCFIYGEILKLYSVSESLTMNHIHLLSYLTSSHSSNLKLTTPITDLDAMRFLTYVVWQRTALDDATQWHFDVCLPVCKTMKWQLLFASGSGKCIMALVAPMEIELECR